MGKARQQNIALYILSFRAVAGLYQKADISQIYLLAGAFGECEGKFMNLCLTTKKMKEKEGASENYPDWR